MSQEIFEIVQGMDVKSIETQLALQCAPLITGLKISNLLIVPSGNERAIRAILNQTGISCYRLASTGNKITYLLFCREQLEWYLLGGSVKEIFEEEGYQKYFLGNILLEFSSRYQKFLDGGKEFPHEMGLLLGYPIEDVKGFVEHQGRNFLYSGYWKVYANKSAKISLFRKYELAQATLIQLLSQGVSMRDIIDSYSEKMPQSVAM